MAQPLATTPIFQRALPADDVKRQALERLYVRRSSVDALIRSLEVYQAAGESRFAPCIPINVAR
jgi:hypothetical protein